MQTNCVKTVQKLVKKSAQKLCNLFVQKSQNVEKILQFYSFSQVFNKNNEILQFLINGFCTLFFNYSSLLFGSFTPFPRRTTITTTLLNNKKENF